MFGLTECVLPGGVKLVWADRRWVRLMLPPDSMNKKAARVLIAAGMTYPIEREFDGELDVSGASVPVQSVLTASEFASLDLRVQAGFCNVRHLPPRVYLWLRASSGWYFLKIGKESELAVFENEFKFSRLVPQDGPLFLTPCVELVRGTGWVGLLSMGLSPQQLLQRRRLTALEVLRSPLFSSPQPAGPFGGIVHCDLASNNVYELDGRMWITDWEMASASGPDYCDAIALATVVAAPGPDEHVLRRILEMECGLFVEAHQLRSALRFLSARGNRAAGRACARLEPVAS